MESRENPTDLGSLEPTVPCDQLLPALTDGIPEMQSPPLGSLTEPQEPNLTMAMKISEEAEVHTEVVRKDSNFVTVYFINDDQEWAKVGTGYVIYSYVEYHQSTVLLVQSDIDNSVLLESKVCPTFQCQKLQAVLIIWCEPVSYGIALSFQYQPRCQEIWEDICRIQGKDPRIENTHGLLIESEEQFNKMIQTRNLVTCDVNKLKQIALLFKLVLKWPICKERLALFLEDEEYIKKLLHLFHICEDRKVIEAIYYLHEIIKGILLINKTSVFIVMFSDECIMDVVGCLEYDPALKQQNKHREFLTQNIKFKEVVPMTNNELRRKLDQTYRMQYILDVLLPAVSMFEEKLSNLSALIFINKYDIITMLQEDKEFLSQVLTELKETANSAKQFESILFCKELCSFSQKLQLPIREALLNTLIDSGILSALKVVMRAKDLQTKSAAIDILSYVVKRRSSSVLCFVMKEAEKSEDGDFFINVVIEQINCDSDPERGRAFQLVELLRYLLDPSNMLASYNAYERNYFLEFFYKHCMHNLTALILSITSEDIYQKDSTLAAEHIKNCLDYHTAQLLGIILELLTFCVEHHTYYIKIYILSNDLLRRILMLLNSKHKFLVLGALRFMRKIVGLKDEIYNCYIITGNLFKFVVNAFLHNGSRYNLLNSAIIELFEYIRVENITCLIMYIMENFFEAFEFIDYVQTFKGLKIIYDREKDH
ncbi:serine/threonine-protein phosphatase 4 regulatory subunit 3-like [Suncus etruscus]|uniref:serine/threonine-protein phosphatase 4 regulatory subunit 3-like n=1 Tax=Suncus etruscus TaxID=109475 RepID=UPI00210FD798|nr:serine/threonine-protein phosphatase 4 regulatory subunit 3-like [Suncus etruscus]